MNEFESEHCPVCHKTVSVAPIVPITDEQKEKYEGKIYVPGEVIPTVELSEEQLEERREIEALLTTTRPPVVELEG